MSSKAALTESYHTHVQYVFDELQDHFDHCDDHEFNLLVGNNKTKGLSQFKTNDSFNCNILPANNVYLTLYYGTLFQDPAYNTALLDMYKLIEKRLLANGVKLK